MKKLSKSVCYYCNEEFLYDPQEEKNYYDMLKSTRSDWEFELFGCPNCMKLSYQERDEKQKAVIKTKGITRICTLCFNKFISHSIDSVDEQCPDCKSANDKWLNERKEQIFSSPIRRWDFVCLGCGKSHIVEIPIVVWKEFRNEIIYDLHGRSSLLLLDETKSLGYQVMKQLCPDCIKIKYNNKEHNWSIDHKPADYWENHDTYYYQSKFITPPWVYPGGESRKKTLMD